MLDGRVAVITGAASGMGLATAQTFVEHGAKVVLADIQGERGAAAAARLGDSALFVRADVTSAEQVESLVRVAVDTFGRLDVMVSNAGAAVDLSPIDELTPAGLDRTLALNLQAHVAAHKHSARQFRAQGTPGSIITTGSVAALQAGWNGGAYSMAKAAVLALVRQTAMENRGTGIRSNAILPGAVLTSIITDMFGVSRDREDEFLAGIGDRIGGETLIGRAGLARDIAHAALFLASDLSAWITGVALPVDGGSTAVTKDATVSLITEFATEFHTRS
ncbi:2,5-dichloro-2,5-cyclohexadiene-1,4-diol dehydrogenase [Nocardia neocaledoniensis NBRC 108232]|uniref:NAD(P)-dependent dehydrogenase (Short-subunit alcohol dehydrogenase family) n=1 Tax=Nocardia neocaledoniensis TaxID=236511 RepID=A0A317N361_9NOCA|nr:SDR family oxidoreductase [Nocardia neocaledoniensis]PWV69000.1 NAD(P)-dependent dehydrogenase (short-subunit alcohol dehydrogenase family) [Nocardia neocaledoniensis]GEM29640.1 2,5-dichloro-2,5-cyclohexadiene-1,4-diol dehydrogenase [Nocardia neocaledoniensis NBRC 108232]